MRYINSILTIVFALCLSMNICSVAQGETITVYTALENEQIRPLIDNFEKSNPGIKVDIVRDSTGVITARFLAEAENPRADVLWQLAATSLLLAQERGMIEPYAPRDLASIKPLFRDPSNPPAWVGGNAWMTAFAINLPELESRNLQSPRSFDDLLNPAYRGLIVMSNPASSGTGFLTVSAILQMRGEVAGWAYLEKLHANIASYEHSGSKPAKMAAAGEAVIAISFCYASLQQLRRGAPIEVVFPREGSGWELEATALVKRSSIKPAARTFVDWASGRDAVDIYGRAYGVVSRDDVKPDDQGYPSEPLKQMAPNDLQWAAANRERILAEWTRRFASGN